MTLIRKGDPTTVREFKGGYDVRISSRSFFGFKGIGGVKLTNLGIGSETYEQNKTRSQARLTRDQRAAILTEIHKRLGENWTSKDGRITIAFKDMPELAYAIEIYPKVSYYIGIRAASAFEKSFWEVAEERDQRQHRSKFSGVIGLEDYQPGKEIIFRHLDKGKRGGIAWTKRIFGEFAEEFHAYWIRQGKPKQGPVFAGLKANAVREFLKECYQAAGIPEYIWQGSEQNESMPLHIWRHTAAQDLLDATDWNFELVAATLGWESIDMLKKHYGSMPPDVQRRIVLKAMGEAVPIIKREFIF
jgi:integrase